MEHANKHSDIPSDLEDHPLMQEVADFEDFEEEGPEPVSDNDSPDLRSELELLRVRNEQLMRIAADFENYKRRQEREREELSKFAGQQLITGLLPVLDNFERALQTEPNPEDVSNFTEGIRMIHRQFLDVLTKTGVSPIEAMGQPFNPEFHEAIMSEANDEVPDETVIGEFQRGYVMHGRLLRPAVVKVSKA
ncbi:MAG: nucleotide exchange factor GrpE [Candidatus Melainabacteria bacterium HGW-Melainabacteria-1]|nr:MAG: nucleotide exchange factor GrpE [Candidatus Melainabacteria bacterium HGW-Melainabacteria-1]